MNIAKEKSRGYFKIKSAAGAFNFDFKDKVVLDIGSSTGGFTEYALEKGAKKVIAVEKGTNQMKHPLRNDPKVELHEKTDIFDFAPEMANRGTPSKDLYPDVIVADVSFISLTKILHYSKRKLSDKNTDFLVMLKPQFEASEKDLVNGVVKNETIRRNIIKNFEQWLKTNGFVIIKKHDNELQGKHGNLERFYWLKQSKNNVSF